MNNKGKEGEKKLISEIVQLSNKAKELYKSKKYKNALELFEQCEKKCNEISSIDRKCECSYYFGLCYFKLFNCQLSYEYLNKSKEYLDCVDKNNFPYLKYNGRLYALITLNLIGLNKKEECINFIINDLIYNISNKFNLEEKVVIFHRLIRDLLFPIRNNKPFTHFIGEFISEQNNILFNGEKGINMDLKSMLNKCLNNNAKKTIFFNNNQFYFKYKYEIINFNNPIISYLDNNYCYFEGCNSSSNLISLKMQMENYLKANKLKISDDFKGLKTADLIKDYIKRIENFNDVWKKICNIFSEVFKNYFVTPKKIIKLCSTSDLFNKKENIVKPNMSKRNSLVNNDLSKFSNNAQFSIKNDMKNIETELYLNGTNSTKKNYINSNTKSNTSNICEGKQSRRKSSNIVGRINIKDEAKIKKLVKTNENSKKSSKKENELYLENAKKKYDNNENNNYDKLRIKNINNTIENIPFNRNYNPFLFSTISKKYSKEQIIRECDLVNVKFNNYIKSYSILSQKGNHKIIGTELEDVNQDVVFLKNNFLLIKNLYLFGVCDGHGIQGHYISSYARDNIPSYLNYIEIDNYISRKNKNIDSLLSSLYNKSENSSVKDIHIIKYFYDKFQVNPCDFSYVKNRFSEISKNLKESFKKIDNDLIKLKHPFDTEKSGTTVCLSILFNKNLICANLGDSRTILCSCNEKNEWKASQLTKDHKPMDKDEYKRIINAGGTVSRMINMEKNSEEVGPYRVWGKTQEKGPGLAMSRSIGDGMAKTMGVLGEPDIYEYSLNENDKFLICATDGIWEYLTNEDVMNIVKESFLNGNKAEDACELLVKNATNIWKKENTNTIDDISCAILFLNIK
jgi:serine/threonine protein phosphatase PrpC